MADLFQRRGNADAERLAQIIEELRARVPQGRPVAEISQGGYTPPNRRDGMFVPDEYKGGVESDFGFDDLVTSIAPAGKAVLAAAPIVGKVMREAPAVEGAIARRAAKAGEAALDMSHAARMQRAKKMGFDTSKTYYHGTPSGPFDEFLHSNYDGITAFFSENKNFAEKFANDDFYRQRGVVPQGEEVPHVQSVFLRAKKPFDHTNIRHVLGLMDNITPKDIQALNKSLSHSEGTITRDALQSKIFDGSFGILEDPVVLKKIKRLGYDSMHLREEGAKNIAVFEPSQIRSVNAAFDPKKKKSGNILAGAAAAAGAGIAAQDDDNSMSRRLRRGY